MVNNINHILYDVHVFEKKYHKRLGNDSVLENLIILREAGTCLLYGVWAG